MKKIFSWFFILQALSLITVGLYAYYVTQAPTLAFSNYTAASTVAQKGLAPIGITIPQLGINLPVYQAMSGRLQQPVRNILPHPHFRDLWETVLSMRMTG
jgi:hypothetical protein